jgi:hypothetical protein
MPEPIALPEQTAQQVERLGPLDFVVGITSGNHAETIGGVVQAAWTGLERSFPGARVAIVHADSGSRDGTVERAAAAMPGERLVQVSTSAATPLARAEALRAIFAVAQRLGTRGCAVLDADVTSIVPDWIERLLGPVGADRADFVAPYYLRHRFDGALTTSVLYPFIRALYGKRLRYPVGGDFACSARLVQRLLGADPRHPDFARHGIDVWITVQALTGGCRLSQAFLGPKTQASTDDRGALSATLAAALGALFHEAERTVSVWQKVRGSEPVPVTPENGARPADPSPADPTWALDSFRLGERDLQPIWALVLSPLALLELGKLARLADAAFRFPDALWARIVYDFALAYHVRTMNRDHLLAAFTPLYAGWLASYVGEMASAPESDVEARIERMCAQFEAEKRYLIARWRWPDRFNP